MIIDKCSSFLIQIDRNVKCPTSRIDCEMIFLSILKNFFSKLLYFFWKCHFWHLKRPQNAPTARSRTGLVFFNKCSLGAFCAGELHLRSHMMISVWRTTKSCYVIGFKKACHDSGHIHTKTLPVAREATAASEFAKRLKTSQKVGRWGRHRKSGSSASETQ